MSFDSIPFSLIEVALCVLYIQAGFILLGYLVLRRLREINGTVAAEAVGRAALAQSLERTLARLAARLEEFEAAGAGRRGKRAKRRVTGLRRKRALDLLAQGRCAVEAAAAAGLRVAEVRILDKLRSPTADGASVGSSP